MQLIHLIFCYHDAIIGTEFNLNVLHYYDYEILKHLVHRMLFSHYHGNLEKQLKRLNPMKKNTTGIFPVPLWLFNLPYIKGVCKLFKTAN